MLEHLNAFALITDSRHGFTRGHSCLTNLLDFFEEVTFKIDESKPVDIIYLNFLRLLIKYHIREYLKI